MTSSVHFTPRIFPASLQAGGETNRGERGKRTNIQRTKEPERGRKKSRDATLCYLITPNNYSYLTELLRMVRSTSPWTSSSYQEFAGRRPKRREIEVQVRTREKKSEKGGKKGEGRARMKLTIHRMTGKNSERRELGGNRSASPRCEYFFSKTNLFLKKK